MQFLAKRIIAGRQLPAFSTRGTISCDWHRTRRIKNNTLLLPQELPTQQHFRVCHLNAWYDGGNSVVLNVVIQTWQVSWLSTRGARPAASSFKQRRLCTEKTHGTIARLFHWANLIDGLGSQRGSRGSLLNICREWKFSLTTEIAPYWFKFVWIIWSVSNFQVVSMDVHEISITFYMYFPSGFWIIWRNGNDWSNSEWVSSWKQYCKELTSENSNRILLIIFCT